MSDPALALDGARHDGIVTVTEEPAQGMITLRGDLSDPALREAVAELAGAVPEAGTLAASEGRAALWMSPDELLLLVPHGEAAARCRTLSERLAGTHHLAVDVSGARAVFRLDGDGLHDVLAKLTPADVARTALPPGRVRRTQLAQVSAAFWLDAPGRARVICFRSIAGYVFELLGTAARPGGEVGFH